MWNKICLDSESNMGICVVWLHIVVVPNKIKRASLLCALHIWYFHLLPLSFSLNEQSGGSFCLSEKSWWTINAMMLLFWLHWHWHYIEKKRVIPDTVIPNKRFLLLSVYYSVAKQDNRCVYTNIILVTHNINLLWSHKNHSAFVLCWKCALRFANSILGGLKYTNRSVQGNSRI